MPQGRNGCIDSARADARQWALIALWVLCACGTSASNGPPARLVAGSADTVIVNESREVRIPLRVLDADGQTLPDSAVRYRWIGGERLSVSDEGKVTCAHSADASVEASLGSLSTTMIVRCRPVNKIYISGPIQFLLPDTAQEMRMQVLDLDGKEISLLKGNTDILDSAVATLDGIRVIPKSPGATIVGVKFGNRTAAVGVHVYERVSTLDALRHGKQFVGIPIRMSGGEKQSWSLPPGTWMVTMLPEADETTGLRLRIDGANCSTLQLTRRRYGCLVKTDATVTVFHPSTSKVAPELSGELLVRHVNS